MKIVAWSGHWKIRGMAFCVAATSAMFSTLRDSRSVNCTMSVWSSSSGAAPEKTEVWFAFVLTWVRRQGGAARITGMNVVQPRSIPGNLHCKHSATGLQRSPSQFPKGGNKPSPRQEIGLYLKNCALGAQNDVFDAIVPEGHSQRRNQPLR